jgi:hypothetical protein
MPSSTATSFVSGSSEHSPAMSHSSKTASFAGSDLRKLTLGGSSGSSRSDEMKTRSMARKAATKTVPASSSSRSKGNAAAAESSRRGEKASKGRIPRKYEQSVDEDDEDDSADSDASSSGDDNDRPAQRRVPSPPQLSVRDRLRLIMSAYDPSQRSPVEFTHLPDRELPESRHVLSSLSIPTFDGF